MYSTDLQLQIQHCFFFDKFLTGIPHGLWKITVYYLIDAGDGFVYNVHRPVQLP